MLSLKMDIFFYFVFFIFFSFWVKSFHVLSLLISMEMSMVLVFFFLMFFVPFFSFFSLLLFIVIVACESALGLILFIILGRFYSKDYINNLCMLKF